MSENAIEKLCVIKSMKVGDVVTEREIEAIHYYLGDILNKLKPVSATILFDEHGNQTIIDPDNIIESVKEIK